MTTFELNEPVGGSVIPEFGWVAATTHLWTGLSTYANAWMLAGQKLVAWCITSWTVTIFITQSGTLEMRAAPVAWFFAGYARRTA